MSKTASAIPAMTAPTGAMTSGAAKTGARGPQGAGRLGRTSSERRHASFCSPNGAEHGPLCVGEGKRERGDDGADIGAAINGDPSGRLRQRAVFQRVAQQLVQSHRQRNHHLRLQPKRRAADVELGIADTTAGLEHAFHHRE